ncbi:nucleotide-binding universal stress UspA family protein [Paraburkholderia atlantica]|uniref:Nucleotide-binding universal stress UspA family protein n=1 Tax=Paraburkholderia atlantica TaxID=2654982 RepID=A0A6I1PXG8_PARAM|nr:universal stress protein [Paraburkholderia atlantica]MBB5419496.1 nucleotide-binding universal stress UspA family protein [Paraburkholderia atlantica]MBB5422011.1 nucleotide-binding universal stress UspA family protein [Paraburkholderia atlantica]MPW07679.1 universal stress protein [Paraburkholderia atlantica]NUY31781.1 universal stress protein [Paraburkholderia atlantica]
MNSPHPVDGMSTLPRRVLIAVDSSDASRQALDYARNLLPSGCDVRLVSVAENPHTLFPTGRRVGHMLDLARDELLRDAVEALDRAKRSLAACDAHIDTEVIDLAKRGNDVVDALIDAADTWRADLMVVGARQHQGLQRWAEGTVSEPLTRRLRCPMLVVPQSYSATHSELPERILFAVDGSSQSMSALQYGIRFAASDTELRAVYVIDRAVRLSDWIPIDSLEDSFVGEGKDAFAAAEPVLARASTRVSTALVRTNRTNDDVAHAIVREASGWDAQLIVMGTHGRRGITRWILGSVAGRVLQITQTPLLLIHASDADSGS